MLKLRKSEGFSLVELMIVVAIMAILAAIAIPTYLSFQQKARTSEARTNLSAVKTCEESYKAENDLYLTCGATPPTVPAGTPVAFTGGDEANFALIGFNPSGNVRYSYAVTATAGTTFTGTADGDLDGDGTADSSFQVTQATAVEEL